MKTCLRIFAFLAVPMTIVAHPGGGMIAINDQAVIFGDPMQNSVWRLESGKRAQALATNLHAHWTTLGLDGQIYSESFQESGGALFRIDLEGGKPLKVAETTDINAPAFAVGSHGEFIFYRAGRIVERSVDGKVKNFRGSGEVPGGAPRLQPVIAYQWGPDATLYLSDGNNLRRIGRDGIVRLVARVDGKLIEPRIWNSTGRPRIWSIAIDARKRIYLALPDTGQVVRLDTDGVRRIIDRSVGGWRVTAVATSGDSVFLLESNESTNDGQRVRVIRGSGKVEMLGQVES